MLQNLLENEVKNMQKLVYDESGNRKEHENILRT